MLRELRQESEYSQEALAAAAGLHRNTTGLIERGVHDPTVRTLYAIVDALEMTMAELWVAVELAEDAQRSAPGPG